ncbi:MAG: ABC transporter substrate-binding protein [Woeseiaceae bacterium]
MYDYASELQSTIFTALDQQLTGYRLQKMDLPQASYLATSLDGDPASLIVTIGDDAAIALRDQSPVIGTTDICLTGLSDIEPDFDRPVSAITRIEPDYAEYLRRLQRTFPDLRTLGVITSTKENQRWDSLERAAEENELKLSRFQITKREELSDALNYVARRADVLFALDDPTIFNQFTARHILVFCLRQRLPIIGPNAGWVRSGSIFSVAYDYAELGRSYGELCHQIINAPAHQAPLKLGTPPNAQKYLLNTKNAELYRMNIELPAAEDVVTYE